MLSRPLPALAAALACALLTGCQPPAPTPTPAPSYQCTPEAGGDAYDCSQAQYDDMVATDKLYAEAEAVYRKFHDEDERILRRGGVTEPTAVLTETTTGTFLENSMDLYRALHKTRTKIVGGEMKIVRLDRLPGTSTGGSIVTMEACVDGSSVRLEEDGKDTGRGTSGSERLYFNRVEGDLKIQNAEGKDVESC